MSRSWLDIFRLNVLVHVMKEVHVGFVLVCLDDLVVNQVVVGSKV